jgi:hypothetical protein
MEESACGVRTKACWRGEDQLHASAVQTPAAVLFATGMYRSTKLPAGTVTLPVAVHDAPVATEQESDVVAMLAGVAPTRRVTVIVLICCE